MQKEDSNQGVLWSDSIPDGCLQCLKKLIDITLEEATQDKTLREKARSRAMEIIEIMRFERSITPALIANRFHPEIKRICRSFDPFEQRKKMEMTAAEGLVQKYPPKGADLGSLLIYSLLGNGIDFFRDLESLRENLSSEPYITLDESPLLISKLGFEKKQVLFLADNAGELYFDIPFMNALAREGHRVYYGVKDAPVQNDLALSDLVKKDLLTSGDRTLFKIVSTGVASVGLEIHKVSSHFLNIYNDSDIVIAKGMGHFETLGMEKDDRLFFLFQAKCTTVANTVRVEINDFIASFGNTLQGRFRNNDPRRH